MKKIPNLIKNQSGAALPFVMIVVLVLAILSSSVVHLTSSNIRQVKYQEHSIQAYYLARSGAELGYEILLMDNRELLDDLSELGPEEVELEDGTVEVFASTFLRNNQDWVRIKSTARLNKGNAKRTVYLEFNKNNPNRIRWVNQ